MKATERRGKKPFGHSNLELYEELEGIDSMVRQAQNPESHIGKGQKSFYKYYLKYFKNMSPAQRDLQDASSEEQTALFLKSMKAVIMLGLCLGLNPVLGILQTDPSKMRFKLLSWKCMYSLFVCGFQIFFLALCLYRMCRNSITIWIMSFVAFYATTSTTTILFFRMGKKWPRLMNEISRSQLDDYVDHRIKIKCFFAVVFLFFLASFEHILAHVSIYAIILDCTPKEKLQDPYYILINAKFIWIFDIGVTYSLPMGIVIQTLNTISMINWNYSDMFLICVSLYLISIFDKINLKINAASKKASQPWVWRSIREDYTRATRLVHVFNDAISGIVFLSFTNNLFFICLQLYNILKHVTTTNQDELMEKCPNFPSGPFHGYENAAYYTLSLSLIIGRFLAVSLLASRVHSAAVQPASVLYGIPTEYYCTEIQRFTEQIYSDDVALSGLQFFRVTKSLVLSVAGTIVTYELVLLQFDSN